MESRPAQTQTSSTSRTEAAGSRRTTLATVLRVVGRTRLRLRLRRAMDGFCTLSLPALFGAALLMYLLKLGLLGPAWPPWPALLLATLPLLGAAVAWCWPIPLKHAAFLVDKSHGLHDRLGSALAFARLDARTPFMDAQMQDAEQHAALASAKRAAPLRLPRDLRAMGLMSALCVAVGLLHFAPEAEPRPEPRPMVSDLAIDPEDLLPLRAMARELEEQASKEDLDEAARLARELNQLFDAIDKRQLSQKELFEKLVELERRYFEGKEGDFDTLLKALRTMGSELANERPSGKTGKALKEGDLAKAQQELEKLAREQADLRDRERRELARRLDRASRQQLDDRALQEQRRKQQDLVRRLRKKAESSPKDAEAQRRLKRQERQLDRLNAQARKTDEQKRQLDRLNQSMRQAAQAMQNKLSQQASEQLQKAAAEMGRFAQQATRLDQMSRAKAQVMDLKDLLRRLGKGKGQKQQGAMRDFLARARPGKGQQGGKMALRVMPGQGGSFALPIPGQGQGPEQTRTSQSASAADGIGNEAGPSLLADKTALKTRRQDSLAPGKQGQGPTRSEVILGAAEGGFSTRTYQRVYREYTEVVEESLKREEVPLGYRSFVKQYFQLIRPQ